jgi:hypothetical protein
MNCNLCGDAISEVDGVHVCSSGPFAVKIPIVDCDREDCRIERGISTTTLMGWTPTYDKYGNQLNRDPNKTTTQMRCTACGKSWMETT